jgi:hypothetical protein
VWATALTLTACGPGGGPADGDASGDDGKGGSGDEGFESKDGDEGFESKDGDEGFESNDGDDGDEGKGENCGNGQLDPGEQCEAGDVGGLSCAGLGFSGGELSCHPDWCYLDTSKCEP